MTKKRVSFSILCKEAPENLIETSPKTPRNHPISDYDQLKAHHVGCRIENEVQSPNRTAFRMIAEERAELLLCLSNLYHQCHRVYRLDDKKLIQLCQALSYKKK